MTSPVEERNRHKIIIFSQVGIVTKTGVGDHLRILSDNLAFHGYTVLRFDQSGMGDSCGEIRYGISIPEFFRLVQGGYYKNDVLNAMSWTAKQFKGYEIFLFGECGGCISILLACAEGKLAVKGIIMLAAPVLLYPGAEGANEAPLRSFEAQVAFKAYLSKAFSPRAVLRLVRGKSDVTAIRQMCSVAVKSALARGFNLTRKYARGTPCHERFNWQFWDAFCTVVKNNTPILFLMPELDSETHEFNLYFKPYISSVLQGHEKNCSIVYLPRTDHSIMFQSSRDHMLRQILSWLERIQEANHA